MEKLEIFVFIYLVLSIFFMIVSNVFFLRPKKMTSAVMASLAFGCIFASACFAALTSQPEILGLAAGVIAAFTGSLALLWSRGYKIATTAYYIATLGYLICLL